MAKLKAADPASASGRVRIKGLDASFRSAYAGDRSYDLDNLTPEQEKALLEGDYIELIDEPTPAQS